MHTIVAPLIAGLAFALVSGGASAATIDVTVLDEGQPVAGADVQVWAEQSNPFPDLECAGRFAGLYQLNCTCDPAWGLLRTRLSAPPPAALGHGVTDAQGRATLSGPWAPRDVLIVSGAHGQGAAYDVVPGEVPARIDLSPSASFAIEIDATAGHPYRGPPLQASLVADQTGQRWPVEVHGAQVQVSGLPRGTYQLILHNDATGARGIADFDQDGVEQTVRSRWGSNRLPDPPRMTLAPADALRVSIATEGGPWQLELFSAGCRVKEAVETNQLVTVSRVDRSWFTVSVHDQQGHTVLRTSGPVADPLRLEVVPSFFVTGALLRNGHPVEGSVREPNPSEPSKQIMGVGHGDGGFEMGPLSAGPHHLVAQAGGSSEEVAADVVLPRDTDAGPLLFSFADGIDLHGRLRRPDGSPVGLGWIRLERTTDGGRQALSGGVDEQGRFTLLGVAPGKWHLEAGTAGFEMTQLEYTADPDVPNLDVTLTPYSALHGVVRWKGSPPPFQVKVEMEPVPPTSQGRATLAAVRATGRFEFNQPVPAGHYRLTAKPTAPDAPPVAAHLEVEVTSEPHAPLLVDLSAAPQLRGQVVDEHDRPVAGAEVWCDALDAPPSARPRNPYLPDPPRSAITDGKGAFTLPGVDDLSQPLWAAKAGYDLRRPRATHGTDTRIRLAMTRLPTFSGQVVDAKGRPIPSFRIGPQRLARRTGASSSPPSETLRRRRWR